VLGLRLYTGPMHDVYNEVLRSVHKVDAHTINDYLLFAFITSQACFTTTVCAHACISVS